MFAIAFLIGIFSYLIFALGLVGLLYKPVIISFVVIYFGAIIFFYKRNISLFFKDFLLHGFFKNKLFSIQFMLLSALILVNIIGVFGPEIGFDALWYHLTIPKVYLQQHRIVFIPGNLLYYSAMPKLTEMLYIPALSITNEIGAKSIHFLFGILCLIVLFQISRKYFSKSMSILICLVFYGNLVVLWESISGYIDLGRTFFELMAFYGFLNFLERKEKKWLIESAVLLGLAISTKLLSIGSLAIYTIVLLYKSLKENDTYIMSSIPVYWTIALIIPLPWFVFSFIHTGSPIYPFFTNLYKMNLYHNVLNPLVFIKDFWKLFTKAQDPLSPAYSIFFPFLIYYFRKIRPIFKYIVIYCLSSLGLWYVLPHVGGGRFILPFLPAFSLLIGEILCVGKEIRKLGIVVICVITIISIGYRAKANLKFVPYLMGKESKTEFLTNHLNFLYGDFVDSDGFFKTGIKKNDMVLLYGFHNLYYVDFPYIDSSWVKKGDVFNYIAVQDGLLPKRFRYWNMIYKNDITHVKLYSLGGQKWVY